MDSTPAGSCRAQSVPWNEVLTLLSLAFRLRSSIIAHRHRLENRAGVVLEDALSGRGLGHLTQEAPLEMLEDFAIRRVVADCPRRLGALRGAPECRRGVRV